MTDIIEDKVIITGETELSEDSAEEIGKIAVTDTEHKMYLIEWETDEKKYKNHYYTNLKDIDYHSYMEAMEKCGMDEWEGF